MDALSPIRLAGAMGLAIRAMQRHMNRYDVLSSACSFLFNTVIEEPDNARIAVSHEGLLTTLFEAKHGQRDEPQMADKVHALLEQLMRASPGPYIDAKRSTPVEPYTLAELAARAVAGASLKDLGMHLPKGCLLSLFSCLWRVLNTSCSSFAE